MRSVATGWPMLDSMHTQCLTVLLGSALLVAGGCKDVNSGKFALGVAVPVTDGQIVLIKQTNAVAAVILRNQRAASFVGNREESEAQMDYSWFYRSDGNGRLSPEDSAVTTGTVTNATRIAFGSVSGMWMPFTAVNGKVSFSLHFDEDPHQGDMQPSYSVCVTAETNIFTIDANDPRWKYRGPQRLEKDVMILGILHCGWGCVPEGVILFLPLAVVAIAIHGLVRRGHSFTTSMFWRISCFTLTLLPLAMGVATFGVCKLIGYDNGSNVGFRPDNFAFDCLVMLTPVYWVLAMICSVMATRMRLVASVFNIAIGLLFLYCLAHIRM